MYEYICGGRYVAACTYHIGVVERLVGPGLVWLGGVKADTRWPAQRSSAVHTALVVGICCHWLRKRMPRSHVLCPSNEFLSEPQLSGTSAAGE